MFGVDRGEGQELWGRPVGSQRRSPREDCRHLSTRMEWEEEHTRLAFKQQFVRVETCYETAKVWQIPLNSLDLSTQTRKQGVDYKDSRLPQQERSSQARRSQHPSETGAALS